MRRWLAALVLLVALVGCRDGGSASDDGLPDPGARGPYAVGLQRMTFERTARDGSPRPLDTWVWYPARGSPDDPVKDGAAPATDGGPYPLVIFSHGSGGQPDRQRYFTEHLASWGYIVAAPPHPGNTRDDCILCGIDVIVRSAMQRPDDVTFVLDQLLAMHADAASPLAGIIDPERTAIAGHSFGGWTAIFVAPGGRFDAAIAMAPGQPALLVGQASKTSVPVLVFASEKDEIIDPDQVREMADAIPAGVPLTYVSYPGGRHLTFIDNCLGCTEALPEARGHELTNRYATAFLELHVRGDQRYAAYLNEAASPDAVVTSR